MILLKTPLQTRGFFVGVISGHISVEALDGTYLGVSLINLLGHLPMLGVTSAIDYLGMRALADTNTHKEVSFSCYMLLINFDGRNRNVLVANTDTVA